MDNSRKKAEKLIQEDLGKYHALFLASRDAVMTLEPPSWRFTSCNPATLEMFRAKNEEEFLSYEPWRLSPPYQPDGKNSKDKAKEMIEIAMRDGSNFFDWTHRRITGEVFFADVLLSRVEINKKIFLHAVVRDISDRKKAEKLLADKARLIASNTMLQQVIETIPVRIFWKDKDLLYLGCNKLFAQDAGKTSPEELIGRSDYEMGWKNEADMYRKDDKDVIMSKKPKINYEEPQTTPQGKQIWLRTSKIPLRDLNNEIIGILGTYEDITEQKEIDKAKTEFVSLASHQLRTPLSIIKWYSEALLSETIGKLNPKQLEYMKETNNACKRMVSLIDALLNVSRIELGTLIIEPELVSLQKIVKICIKELTPLITTKKITFQETYDPAIPTILADRKLLNIILSNLLSNAIKYSFVGGVVNLKVQKQKKSILITVEDTGIGIPKDQQDKMFTKLFRAENAQKISPDGTGLGLYIVHAIITNSGGNIWFESHEGKTVFYVSFPLSGMVKKAGTKQLV